jgi:hypothetical protein
MVIGPFPVESVASLACSAFRRPDADRDDGAALDAGIGSTAGSGSYQVARIEEEQVVGHCINRVPVSIALSAAPQQQGLVVTGDHACGRTIPVMNLVQKKFALEKASDIVALPSLDGRGAGT